MPPSPHILVAIVEDEARTRNALELIIDGTPGMTCARTFEDAESLLEEDIGPDIDVVLLDIGLPGRSGLEAIEPIRARWPRADVLMLTVFDDEDQVFEALCRGASGYLLKNTPPTEILDSISEVQAGGAPMTASIARKVVRFFRKTSVKEEALTDREREVLDHLVEGKTNRQIAGALFISGNTVAYHLKQIYEKLHVHSRAEAVAKAIRRGSVR